MLRVQPSTQGHMPPRCGAQRVMKRWFRGCSGRPRVKGIEGDVRILPKLFIFRPTESRIVIYFDVQIMLDPKNTQIRVQKCPEQAHEVCPKICLASLNRYGLLAVPVHVVQNIVFGRLFKALNRYKDLLNAVPHHGYDNFQIANYFYDGLSPTSQRFLDKMCDGKLFEKEPAQALDFFDRLAAILQSRVFVKHCEESNSNAMEKGIKPHSFVENVSLDCDSFSEFAWSDEPIDEAEVQSSPLMDPPFCDDPGEKCLTAKVVSFDLPYLAPSPEDLLLAHEMNMLDTLDVYYEDPLAKPLTAKEMDAEVDYLYSLLAKQDAYEPIFEELEPMEATIVPSHSPCLDLLTAKEMDSEVDSLPSLLDKHDACEPIFEKLPIIELIDFLGVDDIDLVYNPLIVKFLNNLKIDFVLAMHLVEFKFFKRIR
ncbi:hypothetical protein RHMOL_Rhmol04G0198700 [Rhododendron molle]|uniref:Uncharacterized protein n=1 Tax=Rhododendron molle TaxID=49168 RepID=A0ACC0P4T3_RHOML|nr:hypothetical protein RHMOL_Rhmol04G0198700 [Rhododendron molle]